MTESTEAPAPIGHNSGTVLELVENDPGIIYSQPSLLDDLLAEIEKKIEEREIDLSSDKGRKEVTALSASISRRKASIEEAGLAKTEAWRKATKAVNDLKKLVSEKLGDLRDKARAPLTTWEDEQKERGERIAEQIAWLEETSVVPLDATVAQIDDRIAALARAKDQITEENFGEYLARAQAAYNRASATLADARPRIAQAEKDREELAALRKEREDRAAAEKAKADQEARDKETEAAKADAAAKAAQAERDRLAKEEADKKAEADLRARDFQNRCRVLEAAGVALVEIGIPKNKVQPLLAAIAEGKVPHVSIQF